MVIWKFPLNLEPEQLILIPTHAQILSLQMQNDRACIWANVNALAKKVERKVHTFGTGHETSWITEDLDFVGTYQPTEHYVQGLVFHVFIEREFK